MLAALQAPAYDFTKDWFSGHGAHWRNLVGRIQPKRILEIGCYEGRASVFFIEALAEQGGELVCVDTWAGGADLPIEAMQGVEARFDRNTLAASDWTGFARIGGRVRKMRERSTDALAQLIVDKFAARRCGREHEAAFDLIYIDGSHTARRAR